MTHASTRHAHSHNHTHPYPRTSRAFAPALVLIHALPLHIAHASTRTHTSQAYIRTDTPHTHTHLALCLHFLRLLHLHIQLPSRLCGVCRHVNLVCPLADPEDAQLQLYLHRLLSPCLGGSHEKGGQDSRFASPAKCVHSTFCPELWMRAYAQKQSLKKGQQLGGTHRQQPKSEGQGTHSVHASYVLYTRGPQRAHTSAKSKGWNKHRTTWRILKHVHVHAWLHGEPLHPRCVRTSP